MGLWVEVMCDKRTVGRHPTDITRPLCSSDENANPHGITVKQALEQARAYGWKIGRGHDAVCPGCYKHMKEVARA